MKIFLVLGRPRAAFNSRLKPGPRYCERGITCWRPPLIESFTAFATTCILQVTERKWATNIRSPLAAPRRTGQREQYEPGWPNPVDPEGR